MTSEPGAPSRIARQPLTERTIDPTSDRNHTANHSVMGALGADYYLSKRTMLYTQVGVVDNHGAMNTGISINSALYAPEGTTVGAVVGMRHTF